MRGITSVAAALMLTACGGGDSGSGGSGGLPSPAPAPTPAATPTPTPTPTPLAAPDNLVVVIIDDLAVEDAAFMPGSAVRHYTPRLNQLASQSLIFEQFHTVTPLCTASRFTFLTGTYASRSKAAYFQYRFGREGTTTPEFTSLIVPSDMTLPRRMQSLGFRTGFAGKDHMVEHRDYSIVRPPAAGTRTLNDPTVQPLLDADKLKAEAGLREIGFDEAYSVYPTNPLELPVVETQVHNLDYIVDGAKKFIDGNYDKKFFLVVSLTVPHGPLDPAHSWNADPQMTPFGRLATPLNVLPDRSTLTSRVRAAGFNDDENYLWLDDSVGAVVDSLSARGIRDKTAILVLSDNGMFGKGTIFRSGSHTAAFFNYRNRVGRISNLVANIDMQPTILQMFGGLPAGDGVSAMSLLDGSTTSIRDHVYLELGYARSVLTSDWQYISVRHSDLIKQEATRRGFPLTHWPLLEGTHSLEKAHYPRFPHYLDLDHLYDVRSDPRGQTNLYGRPEYQAIVDSLRATTQAEASKTPGAFKVS